MKWTAAVIVTILVLANAAVVSSFEGGDSLGGRELKGKSGKSNKSSKSSKGKRRSSCQNIEFFVRNRDFVDGGSTEADIYQRINGQKKVTGTLSQSELGCLSKGAFSFRKGKSQLFFSGTCASDGLNDRNPIYAGSGAYAGAEGTYYITKQGNAKTVYKAYFCA